MRERHSSAERAFVCMCLYDASTHRLARHPLLLPSTAHLCANTETRFRVCTTLYQNDVATPESDGALDGAT